MKAICRVLLLAVLSLVFIVSGCAAPRPPVKKERYFWPPPPDTPRIEWLGAYSSEYDLKGGGRFDFVLGADDKETLGKAMYVTADGKGKFYVGDLSKVSFLVFDLKAKTVTRLGGSKGLEGFEQPTGIAVDDEGNIYAADAASRKIRVLSQAEALLRTIDLSKQLQSIASIAFDRNRKRLIVPDVKGHKVVIYDIGSDSVVKTIGDVRGSESGQFNYPTSAAVDGKGNIWICDSMNARIQRFSPEGSFISSFGQRGDGVGDFALIKAVAVSSEGHIYVTDAKSNRINIYDEKGQTLLVFGGAFSVKGPESEVTPGGFLQPQGIYIDQNDTIYVVDQFNGRVQVFQYVTDKYMKEHPITADMPAALPVKTSRPKGKSGGK